jgi:hypothetical protein
MFDESLHTRYLGSCRGEGASIALCRSFGRHPYPGAAGYYRLDRGRQHVSGLDVVFSVLGRRAFEHVPPSR